MANFLSAIAHGIEGLAKGGLKVGKSLINAGMGPNRPQQGGRGYSASNGFDPTNPPPIPGIGGYAGASAGNASSVLLAGTASAGGADALAQGVPLTDVQKDTAATLAFGLDNKAAQEAAAAYTAKPSPGAFLAFQTKAVSEMNDSIAAVGGPSTAVGAQLNTIKGQMMGAITSLPAQPGDADYSKAITSMTGNLGDAQKVLLSNASLADSSTQLTGAAAKSEATSIYKVKTAIDPIQTQVYTAAEMTPGAARDTAVQTAAQNAVTQLNTLAKQLGPNDPIGAVMASRANGIQTALTPLDAQHASDPEMQAARINQISSSSVTAISDVEAEVRGVAALVDPKALTSGDATPSTTPPPAMKGHDAARQQGVLMTS